MGQEIHDSVAKMADQGMDVIEDKVLSGLDATRKATENAADQTAEIQKKAEDTVKEVSQTVANYVQEKPLQAAGIAFAAGIVTTLLLTRR